MADHGPRPGLPGAPRPGVPGAARVIPGRPTPTLDRRGTPGLHGRLAAPAGVAEAGVPGTPVSSLGSDASEVRTPAGSPRSGSPAPDTAAGSPGVGPTGDLAASVDAGLATLAGRPLAEHPEVYARLHSRLTDALAVTVEQGR